MTAQKQRRQKKRMTTTTNQIKIKIFGNLYAVKATAQKIETLYPEYTESPVMLNDDGVNFRIYITVPVEEA